MTQPNPDELASIAIQLAMRLRDEDADPEANGRWLREMLPDPNDHFRLCFVLAAAIPDDRPWTALTAWAYLRHGVTPDPEPVDEGPVLRPAPSARAKPRELKPCGTPAAARRHQYHGEDLDDACRDAERTRDRDRKRAERSAA